MVEMALVLPVLVLILGGIVDFGRYYYQQIAVQSLAREGARAWALGDSPQLAVESKAGGLAVSVDPSTSCANGGDDGDATVTVAVAEEFEFLFLPFTADAPSATASMRCGL